MIPQISQRVGRVVTHGATKAIRVIVGVQDEVVALDAGVKFLLAALFIWRSRSRCLNDWTRIVGSRKDAR